MKRMILFCVATLSALTAQSTAPRPWPTPVPGCHAKGVVMQTFYGTREDILRAVGRGTPELSNFRMHLVFVESKAGAEALLYQRAAEGWNVQSWSGTSIGDVRQQLDAMVLKTRGSACAGEEMKVMLVHHGIALKTSGSSAVQTLEEVLTPVLARYPSGYLRVTALDPCEAQKATEQIARR